MLSRDLTVKIPSNQCIGDSLQTINANFSSLEIAFQTIPGLVEGEGFDLDLKLTPLSKKSYLELSPVRYPMFRQDFDYISNAIQKDVSVSLSDNTGFKSYKFPWVPLSQETKPIATFVETSKQAGVPKFTLFWTASSTDVLSTIFSLNSSLPIDTPTEPNNEVFCFYKDQDILYVGGLFTKLGTQTKEKLFTLDLTSLTGTPVDLEALSQLPTIDKGSVKCISKTQIEVEIQGSTVTHDLLILAGDFVSNTAGRGLIIYNETLKKIVQPFYFNGEINDLLLDKTNKALYLVGEFDWMNLGTGPALASSNERVYCNNLIKFNLNLISTVNPYDVEFITNSSEVLKFSTKLNTISLVSGLVFVGGDLTIASETGEILHKNLVSFRRFSTDTYQRGSLVEQNKFIFDKPIYTSVVDNDVLYLGGQFTLAASRDDFYNFELTNREEKITCYHAVCINVSNPVLPFINTIWKPRFNDIVYKFEIQNLSYDAEIYALGNFTEVNYKSVSYIAAITKATSLLGDAPKGLTLPWNVYLNGGPIQKTNAILKDSDGLFVGGVFTQINGQKRKYYGKVPRANRTLSETQPKTIELEFGGHIVSEGQPLAFDASQTEKVVLNARSAPFGVVNKTTFSPLTQTFKGLKENQLCRFYLKRNGLNDTLQQDMYILGWSLIFEKTS